MTGFSTELNAKSDIRVALETLGCKLNQAETELLALRFEQAGYRLVAPTNGADIYILNTCTVTHIADRKSRHLLRLARRRNPDSLVVATGCYAQRASRELRQIKGVDLVLDNTDKSHLLETVEGYLSLPQDSAEGNRPANGYRFRTRSQIKIQDGCHDFCSYCIVPYVRGREYSLPVNEIIDQVKARLALGYKEMVLTGTKVGGYSWDGICLPQLMRCILDQAGLERLRLSSLQPHELSPELISLWSDDRLCRHIHLPLQSGCEAVLQRMRRQYSISDYRRAVHLIREAVPDVAITTDVMVGFPGESDGEFEESYCFCQEMEFAGIHVFPYSPRAGTLAADMPQVEERVKRERSRRMLRIAGQASKQFRERFLGRTMLVLWEAEENGIWSGLTGNYIRVFTRSSELLTNRLLPVRLAGFYGKGLWGELIATSPQ